MTQPEPAEINIAGDLSELRVPQRERLPDTRQSITHKFNVSGHEGYITRRTVFGWATWGVVLKVAKQGSTLSGLMDTVGVLTSISLQYGVPIEVLVRKLERQTFEPMGHTGNPDIAIATSIVDYIFRWLGRTFSDEGRQATTAQASERERL